MLEEGLEKSYANINTFQDKPLVPYKNHLRKHIMQVFHPVMFWLHNANRAVTAEVIITLFILNPHFELF